MNLVLEKQHVYVIIICTVYIGSIYKGSQPQKCAIDPGLEKANKANYRRMKYLLLAYRETQTETRSFCVISDR